MRHEDILIGMFWDINWFQVSLRLDVNWVNPIAAKRNGWMYGHVLSTQGMLFPRILNIGKFYKATINVVNQQYRSKWIEESTFGGALSRWLASHTLRLGCFVQQKNKNVRGGRRLQQPACSSVSKIFSVGAFINRPDTPILILYYVQQQHEPFQKAGSAACGPMRVHLRRTQPVEVNWSLLWLLL